jgi:hypothetical protein
VTEKNTFTENDALVEKAQNLMITFMARCEAASVNSLPASAAVLVAATYALQVARRDGNIAPPLSPATNAPPVIHAI